MGFSATIPHVSEANEDIRLSIIIPAYMEELNISSTVRSLKEYFDAQPYPTEFIVVDDGSTDRTSELAKDAGATVIRLDKNRGKGAAVRTGMLAGHGEYLLTTDADYPYEIDAIERCFDEFRNGADVVIGSRNLTESDRGRERTKRKVISRIGNVISRLLILPGISDTQAGFKCFSNIAANKIFSLTRVDGWGFDIEALYLARILGLKIREVPIHLIHRAIQPSRIKSPMRTAIAVFLSIFRVHWNRLTGKYRR